MTPPKQKRFSGYSCISARVTGAQSTDVSEIGERDCASNFGAGGWEYKIATLRFGTLSHSSVSLASPTAPQVLFQGRKSTPKGLGVEFSACYQGRFYSLLLTKSLKFIHEFHPELIDQIGFRYVSLHSNKPPTEENHSRMNG
ncbi:hypothetical protein SBX64_17070 [Vibrio rhizosphaerae]|uniref:Uncharacterized protein n=1 Tax=Vibrio rhizosphaerae TaxID=398736 RepID=A0ABU4IZB9_9VIBR|nr:hypothetical protein [Vibrio rhizosphaerae]MDW6094253.1 hypothetical protein [Vibrio rhizosphaerae]